MWRRPAKLYVSAYYCRTSCWRYSLDFSEIKLDSLERFDLSLLQTVWSMVVERLIRYNAPVNIVGELWHFIEAAFVGTRVHVILSLHNSKPRCTCSWCWRWMVYIRLLLMQHHSLQSCVNRRRWIQEFCDVVFQEDHRFCLQNCTSCDIVEKVPCQLVFDVINLDIEYSKNRMCH